MPANGNCAAATGRSSVRIPAAVFGFRARTLFWDRRTAEARIVDFPDEPVMDWLVTADGALSSHGEQARLRVLRYIPLRRVTFLLEDAPRLPPA